MNTKQKIAKAALELFAQRGYHAVSIRDICKVVQIKESSIYYHYKNKKEILDTLYEEVSELIQGMITTFDHALGQTSEVTCEAFCMVAAGMLTEYLLNPNVYQLTHMLSMERLTDPKAEEKYQELIFDAPLQQQEKVFTIMIKRKLFKQADPDLMAKEYYSIIYFTYQRYFAGCTPVSEHIQQAVEEIKIHTSKFYDLYHVQI